MVAQQGGFVGTTRYAVVDEVLLDQGIAYVLIDGNTEMRQQAHLAPVRTGRIPQKGERWLIDKAMGYWTFYGLMAAPDLAFPASAPIISGSGSPVDNQVVPTMIGQTYIDQAVTLGAVEWNYDGIKRKWEVSRGDTGWLNMKGAPWFPTASQYTSSYINLRRKNAMGHLAISLTASATGTVNASIPNEFSPSFTSDWLLPVANGTGVMGTISITSTGAIRMSFSSAASTTVTLSWPIGKPWPAVIPGVPLS